MLLNEISVGRFVGGRPTPTMPMMRGRELLLSPRRCRKSDTYVLSRPFRCVN